MMARSGADHGILALETIEHHGGRVRSVHACKRCEHRRYDALIAVAEHGLEPRQSSLGGERAQRRLEQSIRYAAWTGASVVNTAMVSPPTNPNGPGAGHQGERDTEHDGEEPGDPEPCRSPGGSAADGMPGEVVFDGVPQFGAEALKIEGVRGHDG